MNTLKRLALAALLLGGLSLQAAVPATITAMTTDGTTVFTAVSTLVVTMVGFFILIKIVKGIRR